MMTVTFPLVYVSHTTNHTFDRGLQTLIKYTKKLIYE